MDVDSGFHGDLKVFFTGDVEEISQSVRHTVWVLSWWWVLVWTSLFPGMGQV